MPSTLSARTCLESSSAQKEHARKDRGNPRIANSTSLRAAVLSHPCYSCFGVWSWWRQWGCTRATPAASSRSGGFTSFHSCVFQTCTSVLGVRRPRAAQELHRHHLLVCQLIFGKQPRAASTLFPSSPSSPMTMEQTSLLAGLLSTWRLGVLKLGRRQPARSQRSQTLRVNTNGERFLDWKDQNSIRSVSLGDWRLFGVQQGIVSSRMVCSDSSHHS